MTQPPPVPALVVVDVESDDDGDEEVAPPLPSSRVSSGGMQPATEIAEAMSVAPAATAVERRPVTRDP